MNDRRNMKMKNDLRDDHIRTFNWASKLLKNRQSYNTVSVLSF